LGYKVDIAELRIKLKDIFPSNWGGGDKLLWDMLRDICLLKYVRQSQLKDINPLYSKICATKKLQKLVKLELLKNPSKDVFIAGDVLSVLKYLGYNTKILPKNVTGEGGINELNNTEIFIQALKLPDYLALLYPNFEYIKPDALLVRGTKERYKLEFLEVEASKSNWSDWLENKRINYLKLAQDRQVYSYWKAQCNYLDMPVPDIKDFKFSVSIIGKINKDFGEGFNFRENLYA
jgi:hypothetical protein